MLGGIVGPYRLDAELGAGGMGTVYRASGADGAVVAIKVVHPHLIATRDFRERFEREARVGLAIRHRNVVGTLACLDVEAGGKRVPALVLEYVEGRSLSELLHELKRVPEDLCRHLAREIARGLEAIHAAGIVHRDLKPGNVLITPAHEVKVMDLGLARSLTCDDGLSSSGVFVGTASYAAPEQFKGAAGLDRRADLYSLGALLYELATGELPFRAESVGELVEKALHESPRRPGALAPQLSPFFEELVLKLLAKSPADRFASAAELGDVLDLGERSEWWVQAGAEATKPAGRPARRIRIPRETEMWGREKELADLVQAWEAAKAGEGRVVLVEGETGIGKSRLVEELLLRLDAEDVHVVTGGCPPGGAATASGAFTTAYREHLGTEHLETKLRRHLQETPPLVPAFAALLRGEMPPSGCEPLTKDSLQTCFVHATRSLAAEKPLVVVIDDLHFAPEEGRGLFAALAMAVPGHRVLLVGTARPGLPGPWIAELERLGHVARQAIRRLDDAMVRTHLTAMLGKSPAAEGLASRIAAKAGGNPYFVFEILRGLRESGHLSQAEGGTWSVADRTTAVDIPSSVKDLVAARLGALADEDREVLEVAACAGAEFDGRLVAEALGRPRLDVLRRLGRIERETSLVRAAAAKFLFDHHAVHEVLYERMPQQLREEIHGAVGDALERASGAAGKDIEHVDGAVAVAVCEQFVRSAEAPRALRYLDPALTHLEKRYLNEAAVQLADGALDVSGLLVGAERARTLLRLARSLHLLGLRVRQEGAVREAERIAESADDPELLARAATALGHALHRGSRFAETERAFRRAIELERARGDRRAEGAANTRLGDVLITHGRHTEATEHIDRALEISREIADRAGEALAIHGLGRILHLRGRFAEAGEQFARSLAFFREIGDREGESAANTNLGVVLLNQGRVRDAQERFETSLAIERERGYRRGVASVEGLLGTALHSQGRLTESREHRERALAIFREIGDRRGEVIQLHNLGSLFSEAGDVESAKRHFAEESALAGSFGMRRNVASSNLALGWLQLESGEEALARESLRRARDESSHIDDAVTYDVRARCLLARLPDGDKADAERSLLANEHRLKASERLEARFLLWKATGDRTQLLEAKRLLDEAVAKVPEDVRVSMLTNLSMHREIVAASKAAGL